MFRHKKSASEEAQSHSVHVDCTPSAAKSHAEYLFSKIGSGRDKAMKRPRGSADRYLRDLISKANQSGDCIINIGDGYFRPDENDGPALRQYINMEKHRANEISKKALMMEAAYKEMTGGNQ